MERILLDPAYRPVIISFSIIASFIWPVLGYISVTTSNAIVEEQSSLGGLLFSATAAPALAYTVMSMLVGFQTTLFSEHSLSPSLSFLYLIASCGLGLSIAYPIYLRLKNLSIPTLPSVRLDTRDKMIIFNTILLSLAIGFGLPFLILLIISFIRIIPSLGTTVGAVIFALNSFLIFEVLNHFRVDITGNIILDTLMLVFPATAFAVCSVLGYCTPAYHLYAGAFSTTSWLILTLTLMFTLRISFYIYGA